MVRRNLARWVAVLVIFAVGLAALALARSIGPFRFRPSATTAPVTSPQGNPAMIGDQTKPHYEGQLGDFIVSRKGSSAPPCPRPLRPAKNEKIKASDLYSPVFGDNLEGFVAECADGRITVIEIYGPEIIGRGYFVGKPIVHYEAPLDRLKLLTIAGKPAIVQLPLPGFPETLRLAVIERFPSTAQPGILLGIEDTDKTLEAAIELATEIMGVRR